MRFLPIVLLALGSLPALASTGTPEETAQAFFTARLANDSLGAPSGMELADFSTYLGPELVCLLGAARRYNDAHLEALPDQPAPFSSGDLYSGGDRTPVRFTLGKATVKSQRATLKASFEYEDGEGGVSKREETLQMLTYKRRWVINDIEYSEAPAFTLPDQQLVAGLRHALGQGSKLADWDARQLAGCPVDGELARLKAAQQRKEARAAKSGKKSAHTSSAGKKGHSSTKAPAKKSASSVKAPAKKAASTSAHHKSSSTSSKRH